MAVKKLRVGLIGLGARGSSLLESVLLPMEDVEITAVCDVYEDRTASATALLEKAGKHAPSALQSADQLLRMPALDAVVILSLIHISTSSFSRLATCLTVSENISGVISTWTSNWSLLFSRLTTI